MEPGTSLAIQWLRLCTLNAKDTCYTVQPKKERKKEKEKGVMIHILPRFIKINKNEVCKVTSKRINKLKLEIHPYAQM